MRSKKDQNIVKRLRFREIIDYKPGIAHHTIHRKLYQNVFPNKSIMNIETPSCFLRKFTPDGRFLIAFSNDQCALVIYEYRGPSAANEFLTKLRFQDNCGGPNSDENGSRSRFIRSRIFSLFFKLKHVVHLSNNFELLNRECSLFTEDSRYIIVASAAPIGEESYPSYYEVLRTNESLNVNSRRSFEDYCLHLIDIHSGKRCDTLVFKTDRIMLSHNQGIYLHKNVVAILSIQHQLIHIYNIIDDQLIGKRFVGVNCIGRFCYEDDELLLRAAGFDLSDPHNRPYNESWINSLKHRLLAYLFRHSQLKAKETGDPRHLAIFYQNFEHYHALKMWKMQLLDEDHLLIKYTTEDAFSGRSFEFLPSFFVFYQISTASVLFVHENTSTSMLGLFEHYCDCFRNNYFKSYQHISSPSNNIYARLLHQKFKDAIIHARCSVEATRRTLSILPISAQSYSPSPYLDLSLFSYDDKFVSVMERPKSCGEHSIKFYARDAGYLRFKIHAEMDSQNVPHRALRLVVFAFHPYDPLALSFQRTNAEYIVNLHLRHIDQS